MSRLRVPTANGDVLAVPSFDAIPALVEENRRRLNRDDVQIGGMSLRELRALARREMLDLALSNKPAAQERDVSSNKPAAQARGEPEPLLALRACDVDTPLLLAGHQPELSHPGVWAKNFALNGLAKKLGGIPLNLIVDNDTLKSTSLHFPVLSHRGPKIHSETVAFDTFSGEVPYEDRLVIDPEFFRTFPERAAPVWANWGFEPLLARCWASGGRKSPVESEATGGLRPPLAQNIGEIFTAMRMDREEKWGCRNLELNVSRLTLSDTFARFACHLLRDLPRFRDVYNAAIRTYREINGIHSNNHPAPELAVGEAPFWVRSSAGRRERATPTSDVHQLRPRALTLTLFARVCLGDFFIHGIGGGKYDEVTDDIIRNYFGVEPPAYQVLSATLHLPLKTFPSTPNDLKRAERRVRDLNWNPQRHLSPGTDTELADYKSMLAQSEPPLSDHAERKMWFRVLQQVTQELRTMVADQVPTSEAELERIRAEVAANAVLQRRDYSWVLYPEQTLRPFLQQFLNV